MFHVSHSDLHSPFRCEPHGPGQCLCPQSQHTTARGTGNQQPWLDWSPCTCFYHPRLGFGVHNNYVAKHLAQKRGTWRDQGLGKCDFHYMEYIDVTRPNHIEIMPYASWLPLFLVTELWFRHFLEPKLWRWTRTLARAFPFCFFFPKGSKRCCTVPNAIDIALESAPLRSFKHFRLKILTLRCALHHWFNVAHGRKMRKTILVASWRFRSFYNGSCPFLTVPFLFLTVPVPFLAVPECLLMVVGSPYTSCCLFWYTSNKMAIWHVGMCNGGLDGILVFGLRYVLWLSILVP